LKISFTEEIADVSDKVGFNGGNDREKRMYDVALRTLRLCMREFLVDGVKRDRLPWAGDLSISLLANAYSFRDADIVKRTLRVLDSAGWKAGDINGIVDYSLWWVISHDLYQKHFNDNSFLNDEYSRIAGRLESFAVRDEAQKVVEKIWGGMLDLGATTFWEGFNPAEKGEEHFAFYGRPYAKSLCHAWSSAPVFLLRILKSDTVVNRNSDSTNR
jgi:hypothetical protein